MRRLPARDSRGRFIAGTQAPVIRIGCEVIRGSVVAPRRGWRMPALLSWIVTAVVAVFSAQSLAGRWGAP